MSANRPKPLTAAELQTIRAESGDDPLVNKLLWEISRLRDVVHRSYTYIGRLTRYMQDSNERSIHCEYDDLFEHEPVVEERIDRPPYTSPPGRRWPHLPIEKELKIIADMEARHATYVEKRKAHDSH